MNQPLNPTVTAAILNYDGRHLLEVVLPSLAAQTFTDFRTLVVDNGSHDDSVIWLRANWPDVEIVSLAQNVGVTTALNRCFSAAESEFVLLLNNDMELEPSCLAELVAALREYPGAGSACPKLVDYYDRAVLDGTGDVYIWNGAANRRGQGERDEGQYNKPQTIFGACGGAALYRGSAVDLVGRFDEQFFAIYEDVDWSFRAQLAGLTCRYTPSAVAYHMGSATLGRGQSEFALYHNWRNGIWVVAKDYPLAALLRNCHRLLGRQLMNLLDAVLKGRFRLWLRVWRDALRGLPVILRKRREVQSKRRATVDDLKAVIGTRW
jgi:GT2 family glycosyltransferase